MIAILNSEKFFVGDESDILPSDSLKYLQLADFDIWYDKQYRMERTGNIVLLYSSKALEYIVTPNAVVDLKGQVPQVLV